MIKKILRKIHTYFVIIQQKYYKFLINNFYNAIKMRIIR